MAAFSCDGKLHLRGKAPGESFRAKSDWNGGNNDGGPDLLKAAETSGPTSCSQPCKPDRACYPTTAAVGFGGTTLTANLP
jgi:hypothetical protein